MVSIYYDPMIAKIIVHTPDRRTSIRKMIQVLSELVCLGCKTNQSFLLEMLRHPKFQQGDFSTAFIAQYPLVV